MCAALAQKLCCAACTQYVVGKYTMQLISLGDGEQCAMLCAASYPRIVPTCHIADLLAVMEGEPSMMP